MASQEEDNKLECISNVNKEQERYYLTVYKKYDSILNDKTENFEKKVTSLIEVWSSISELNFSQFDIRYVIQIIDWAKLHALNIVLTGEWRNTKESCRNSLLESIEKAQSSLASVNDAFSSRCHKLADVVKKPWENPVLKNLIQEKDAEIGSKEIEFFCVETAYLVSVRLKKLCENHCEDLALNLVTNFLKYKNLAAEKNFNLNATETQLWFIFDIYVALLYKFQNKSKIVEQFEELKLEEGVLLIKRFAKKRVKISKIWRNCQKIAIFGSRFFMSRTLIKYTEDYKTFLIELLKTYLAISNTEALLQEFVLSVRNITKLADASSLCIMCEVIHREAADKLRVFAIEMYIRALTTDMNELERLKHVNEEDKVKSTTSRLAKTFTNLADLLDDHVKVARECVLTAFSLEPTKERLKRIEELAKRSGFPVLDTGQEWKCRLHPPVLPTDDLAWVCPECGEWMCKPELTAPLQMNMALHEALQESVLGISEALCDDLVVCLSNPRYQILSWLLSWGDLYRLCILYLNDPEKTKNFVTELKFVDVDYSLFEHIKREPVDEYTGIEKGYEQYLDLDFVSDEETSSVSEDSMSHERVGLGSDGAGEPYRSLPQPKSDPVTLKSLRMFRPSLKRKKEESDAPTIDKKIATQALSATSLETSSLGSYLTSSQYNPQSDFSKNPSASIKTYTTPRISSLRSVGLPKAAVITRQSTTLNASQISAANNFSIGSLPYAAKSFELAENSSNFDQANSRIQNAFNSNVNLVTYSSKTPEVRKTVNLSMSPSTILQPESSVFNTTNLSSASSTSYVSNIIKSTLSYGVPKVTVSNSSYASTISNETMTNSHSFGSLNEAKFSASKLGSFTSNLTSQKNTSPHQSSKASLNSSQKNIIQQDALTSHSSTFQKNTTQQVTNNANAVPDLDALLKEIETNNKYETDPKNGVAATLLQLGGQVAKNQKQSIQVPHQSNLNQTPTKLPQETSLPNGTTEECKMKLRNSSKPVMPNLLGEILDQTMEPLCKLRKLTHESNSPEKVSSPGKTTFNIIELQVKIPKLNLEKYSKQDKLSPLGKILDKTGPTSQTQKTRPTIQASTLTKATRVPAVLTKSPPELLIPLKAQCPPKVAQWEGKPWVPLTQCNPLLFSKPEHSTLLQDKLPLQTGIPAVETRCQTKQPAEQTFPTLPCQKEQSSMPQRQLQKTTILSTAQSQVPEPQLKVVLNREHCLVPRRLESVIIIPPGQAREIISQALPQQRQDSKCLHKEPVSERHSASISLVKNQGCPQTTSTSRSLLKAGTKRLFNLFSQFTDKEIVSQRKSQTICTLADSLKIITPTTMDCDKDKKVQIDNEKTDIEMTEVEDVNSSTAEDNNNHFVSQVSSKKTDDKNLADVKTPFNERLSVMVTANVDDNHQRCVSQVSLKKTDGKVSDIEASSLSERLSDIIKVPVAEHEKNQETETNTKQISEEWEVSKTQNINDSITTNSDLTSDNIRIGNETNIEEVEDNPENTHYNSNNNDIIILTENTKHASNKTTLIENRQVKSDDTLLEVNKKMDCDKTEKNVQINIETKKPVNSECNFVERKEESPEEATKWNTKDEIVIEEKNRKEENESNIGESENEITASKQNSDNKATNDSNIFETNKVCSDKILKVVLEKNKADKDFKNIYSHKRDKKAIEPTEEPTELTFDAVDLNIEIAENIVAAEYASDDEIDLVATVSEIKENIRESMHSQEVIKSKMVENNTYQNSSFNKEEESFKIGSKEPFLYVEYVHNYCGSPKPTPNTSVRQETSCAIRHTTEQFTKCETSPTRRETSPARQLSSEHLARRETSPEDQGQSEHLSRRKTSPARRRTSEHSSRRKVSPARQRISEHPAKHQTFPTRRSSEHSVRSKTSPTRQLVSEHFEKRETSSTSQRDSEHLSRHESSPARHRSPEHLARCESSPSRQCLWKKHVEFRSASVSPSQPRSSKIQVLLEDVFDDYYNIFTDNSSSSSETDKENIVSSDDSIADSHSSDDLDNENGAGSNDTQTLLPRHQWTENQNVKKYSNTHKRKHDNVPCFKVDQEKSDSKSTTDNFEAKELSVVLKRLPPSVVNRPPGIVNRERFEKNPETASIILLQERLRERIRRKANAPICILYNKDEKTQPLLDFNIRNQMNQKLFKKKRVKQKSTLKPDYNIHSVKKSSICKKKQDIQKGILKKKSYAPSKKAKKEKHVRFKSKPQVFLYNYEDERAAKYMLSNVPGLNDFSEVRPRNTEHVVNVVQVSGARSSTVSNQNTQTSTQVTPHIQRIGQPKQPEPKSDRLEEKPDQSPSSSATTSRESLKPTSQAASLIFGGQIKPGQKCSGTSRQTPHINILSQQILKQPSKPVSNQIKSASYQHKNEWKPPPPIVKDDKTATIKVEPEDNAEVQASKSLNTNLKIVTSTTQACGASATATSSSQGGTILQFICKSSSLPKFQQAFGKTVYQTNSSNEGATESTATPTSENVNQTATVLDTKKISAKAVPVNVQPITGNVIFRGQVPVGQTVSLIPPGSSTRQLFRITGSTHEQISLVKETVIQNKMSALLAAALQGKPKITEQNGELVEEYSATRITLCRPGTVPPNATRIVKPVQLQIPANVIRAPQPNVSSTTLEQLREFDMVYKQVKERSSNPAQPETTAQSSQESPQQQRISFTYVNQVQKYTQLSPVVVVSSYSPLQQTVSPALTVTSQSGAGACLSQVSTVAVPKVAVKTSKGKNIKSSATKTSPTAVPAIPKPQQKPQEDEHTTQRIFDILAEYAEQLRNSPDLNNKPAPRRRSNPPTNPSSSTSGSSSSKKKKKKSSSSTTSNLVETDNEDLTMGSEDSSGGNIVQLSMTDEEQSESASITPPETNLEPATSNTPTPRPLIMTDTSNQPRNVIIADSSVGEALKMPNTTLIMPGSYIMPVSVVKGGQQIAVVSGGSKILTTVPARSGQNMLLFQSFVNQNKKGGISTVKYSTIQPFSGISSQNVARVSPQPPVMLPSNSVATVALGQPITLKKLDDNDRGTNTELLLTISQPREAIKVEQSPEIPQPDSSTNLSSDAIEVKIEEGSQSDSSSNEVFNTIQKTNSVATSVIASLVKKEQEEQSDNSTDVVDTSIVKVEEPNKQVERIGSVLVNASTSNGPMLFHTNPRYRKPPENVESTTTPTKEFNHVAKAPPPGTKIFKSNAVYYAIRTKKAVGKKMDSEMQKQAAMEREIRLQKSLSEECEDLGVDEPSTSDLFPEADLLFDSNHSPSYDHTGQRIQVTEVKAKASMNLYSDDENSGPMRSDLFDYVEYHSAGAGVDQMNGNNASNESASSCDDSTLLPNCGTMSEVTLNSPISPEYTDSTHAVNKYKYKYTNRKKGEKAVRSQTEHWSEVTSTEDAMEMAKEDETPIAIQEETVIGESVTEIETMVENKISPEKEFAPRCPVHGSTDTRVSRKNMKKSCSCFNGSKSPTLSNAKRRVSSPKCQMPTPSKKPLLSKKR